MLSGDILIDCDGVLSDFVGHVATSVGADPDECREWDIRKWLSGEQQEAFNTEVHRAGWCESMPVYPEAPDAVDALRKLATDRGRHLLCLTEPFVSSRHWHHERQEWLVRHLGFRRNEVLFVDKAHKPSVDGVILIEDHEPTADAWRARRRGPRSRSTRPSAGGDRSTGLVQRTWNEGDMGLPAITSFFVNQIAF